MEKVLSSLKAKLNIRLSYDCHNNTFKASPVQRGNVLVESALHDMWTACDHKVCEMFGVSPQMLSSDWSWFDSLSLMLQKFRLKSVAIKKIYILRCVCSFRISCSKTENCDQEHIIALVGIFEIFLNWIMASGWYRYSKLQSYWSLVLFAGGW